MFYLLNKRIKQLETRSSVYKKKMNDDDDKRKNKTLVRQSKAEDKCLKYNVRKPKSKVLHLALQAGLGKEDCHAKGLIR